MPSRKKPLIIDGGEHRRDPATVFYLDGEPDPAQAHTPRGCFQHHVTYTHPETGEQAVFTPGELVPEWFPGTATPAEGPSSTP